MPVKAVIRHTGHFLLRFETQWIRLFRVVRQQFVVVAQFRKRRLQSGFVLHHFRVEQHAERIWIFAVVEIHPVQVVVVDKKLYNTFCGKRRQGRRFGKVDLREEKQLLAIRGNRPGRPLGHIWLAAYLAGPRRGFTERTGFDANERLFRFEQFGPERLHGGGKLELFGHGGRRLMGLLVYWLMVYWLMGLLVDEG